MPFAAVAVAVWLLWAVIVPWIDDSVPWHDTIRAGDRIRLTEDVTFAPAVGWGLISGLRTTDRTKSGLAATQQVEVTADGVSFFVQRGPWTGTPQALLRQITKITHHLDRRQGHPALQPRRRRSRPAPAMTACWRASAPSASTG